RSRARHRRTTARVATSAPTPPANTSAVCRVRCCIIVPPAATPFGPMRKLPSEEAVQTVRNAPGGNPGAPRVSKAGERYDDDGSRGSGDAGGDFGLGDERRARRHFPGDRRRGADPHPGNGAGGGDPEARLRERRSGRLTARPEDGLP